MQDTAPEGTGPRMIQTAQIIAGSMMTGVIAFALIALVITRDGDPEEPFMAWISTAFAAVALALRYIVPESMASSQRRSLEREAQAAGTKAQLDGIYLTKTIIAYALLEGAAFFCLVTYIVEQHWVSLITVGVLFLLMMTAFPSYSKFESWAEGQKQIVDLETTNRDGS